MLLAVACGTGEGQPAPHGPAGRLEPSEPFGLATLALRPPGDGAAVRVPVYDAFEPDTRQRGLMHREELPAGTGMVFRFPEAHSGGFWMKNTLIPLSIAFFDSTGEVLAVLDMEPCSQDPCPSYDPDVTYAGALEVNRGFFTEIGLTPGWRIDLPSQLPPAV